MGDRYFDLGNFAVNNELGGRARRPSCSAAYFGEPATPARLAALRLMRFMSDFREAMWGSLQGTLSDLDFDFGGYAGRALRAAARDRGRARTSRPCWRRRMAPRAELPARRAA